MALGSLGLAGIGWFEGIERDATVDILARLGVVILLFEVGLESTVRDMVRVGLPSLMVAILGVAAPFVLGWGVGALLLPDRSVYVHAFLGATLTATSVGITARVLRDLGRSQTPEARVILGAAVIDDVLGLVILAIVAGLIATANQGEVFSYAAIGLVLGKALAFLFGSILLGVYLSPRLFGLASRLEGQGVLLATALVFCFALAYLASVIGLAPIVGAYAAGLILENVHFRDFANRGERQLEEFDPPAFHVLSPRLLRRDGNARRSGSVRSPGGSWPRGPPDDRCDRGQAAVLAWNARPTARSDLDRDRHDSPRRGGLDLRQPRPWTQHRRPTDCR